MTVIVGLADGKNIWVGGDSCASSTKSKVEVQPPKVFVRDLPTTSNRYEQIVMGGCGSFRLLQLLEYGLDMPKLSDGMDIMYWLTIDFADALRDLVKDKGLAQINNNVETMNGDFLIGIRGQLYHVEDTFQTIKISTQEYSTGCGCYYAMGSLFSTRGIGMKPEERIETALKSAAYYDPRCSAPFDIIKI